MAAPLIPIRPKGKRFALKLEEMDCLTWYLLSGCPREEAFLKFVRPDYIGTKNAAIVASACKQFFSMADVQEYMEAYRNTINELSTPKEPKINLDNIEDRKARAKTKLVEFAMSLTDNIDSADDPEFVLKLADKTGLLDMGDGMIEKPRRYLPVSCGDCEYRKFVEENCDTTLNQDTDNDRENL